MKAIIPGLILLLIYVAVVIGLSGCCALLVERLCHRKDDHKSYKITHVPTNSRNIHRP